MVSCGVVHLVEVITLWRAVYWLSTAAKVATAIASVCTGAVLICSAGEIVKVVMENAHIAELRETTAEDIGEKKRIELELKQKSEKLGAVTDALNTFLQTGDWNAASQPLLSFALKSTKSELGFLGVVVDGPALRVLAQDGAIWNQNLNRELYEGKMR